jgi:hypothetical protein
LTSSLCSAVKLFRRALSRSRLARFLSSELFAIGCLWSAITVAELPVTSFTCLLPVLCTTFWKMNRIDTRWEHYIVLLNKVSTIWTFAP